MKAKNRTEWLWFGVTRMANVAVSSGVSAHSLAEQLANYAHGLRFEDLDAATVERVKTHVIDTIGCGIGAFDDATIGKWVNLFWAFSRSA